MAFQIITAPEVETGATIDAALLGKVKNNFDEHESELTVLQIAKPEVPVGTVVYSILTLAQIQAESGNGWVLASGQSIVGSRLATVTGMTNAPDLRGVVARGKDNGRGLNPDGDLALGTYQADQFGSHTHIQNSHNHTQNSHSHNVTSGAYIGTYGSTVTPFNNAGSNSTIAGSGTTATNNPATATNQNSGGNETRMKSVTLNAFIKIN